MNKPEGKLSDDESFEDLLKIVGTLGKRNILMLALLSFTYFVTGIESFSYGFLGKTPDYRCQNEFLELANWTMNQKLSISAPLKSDGHFSLCEVYDAPYDVIYEMPYEKAKAHLEENNPHLEVTQCRNRQFEGNVATTVTQWDLVCERRALYSTTQSAVQLGKLLGSGIFGLMSDRYGRKYTYIVTVVGFTLTSLLMSISTGIWMFIILRTIAATFGMGAILASYVLNMEMTLTRNRSMIAGVTRLPWGLGLFYLAGVAFYVRTWYYLQVLLTVPCILQFYAIWAIPESPRWLIINQKYEEAYHILKDIADSNKKTLPEKSHVLKIMNKIQLEHKTATTLPSLSNDGNNGRWHKLVGNYLKSAFVLLLDKRYRTTTIGIGYCWFAVSIVYYGVSLASPSPGTAINDYAYLAIGAVAELVISFVSWYLLANFGRKKSMNVFYLTCAISIFVAMILIILEKNIDYIALQWGLFVVGRIAIGGALVGVFLYTAELYPTSLRAKASGEFSMTARFSSIFSSYINDLLGQIVFWGPSALFAAISALSAVAIAVLPETMHKELPDFVKRQDSKTDAESNAPRNHEKLGI